MSEQTPPRTTLTINWLQIAGGALAAVTSAVLLAGLKSLGTYGTLVGAALGSVAASTAAAIYSHYLNASRERLAEAARKARERRHGPGPIPPDDQPDPPVVEERDDLPSPRPAPDPLPRRRFRGRHAVLLGIVAFLVSVGGIAGYEVVTGTSVTAEVQGSSSSDGVETGIVGQQVTPTPSSTQPTTPTETSTTTTSTASVTTSPSETATETATETGTGSPTSSAQPTSSSTKSASSSSSASSRSSASSAPSATTESGTSSTSAASDGALATPTGDPTAP
ncbi:MAG: hypothetical protein ACRYF3_04580 [Janthinobacterium lividum]